IWSPGPAQNSGICRRASDRATVKYVPRRFTGALTVMGCNAPTVEALYLTVVEVGCSIPEDIIGSSIDIDTVVVLATLPGKQRVLPAKETHMVKVSTIGLHIDSNRLSNSTGRILESQIHCDKIGCLDKDAGTISRPIGTPTGFGLAVIIIISQNGLTFVLTCKCNKWLVRRNCNDLLVRTILDIDHCSRGIVGRHSVNGRLHSRILAATILGYHQSPH